MRRVIAVAVLVAACSGSRPETKSAAKQGAAPAETQPTAVVAQAPAVQPDAGVPVEVGKAPQKTAYEMPK